ncbi:MAG TPA: CPBP family intramembrane glutamic endopeptidase [Chloroflexia bacterium]|nr:CPBP family intramembrane glutamic endopeptidase [Chloroflexia bacterium]
MNPLIRLVTAAILIVAWFVFSRVYSPENKLAKNDPVGNIRRREIVGAFKAMAFFCLLWFVASTVVIFIFGLVIAIVAPPNQRGFADAFSEVINSSSGFSGPLNPFSLWGAVATLVATVAAVWISQRVARGQSFLKLGLQPNREMPLDLLLGLILGPLLFAIIFQAESLLGYLAGSTGPHYDWGSLFQWLVIFLCIAISEELVVRGYFLQITNQVWGGAIAVIATSVGWSLAHVLNPHISVLAVMNVVIAGLVFAYAYNITGRLWLPMAFHFSWNFAEGAIFGYPVSGYTIDNSVFQTFINGPQEVTGGLFGPEGGMLGLFAIILAGLAFYAWDRLRRPPQTDKEV